MGDRQGHTTLEESDIISCIGIGSRIFLSYSRACSLSHGATTVIYTFLEARLGRYKRMAR